MSRNALTECRQLQIVSFTGRATTVMAALDELAIVNAPNARRKKALPPHSRMRAYGLALRALGALLAASMTILLSANTVFAHTLSDAEYERFPARSRQPGSFTTTAASECILKIVISDAAASIRSRPIEVHAMPIGDESDDLGCDDCCGVACHAAVRIASNDIVGRVPAFSKVMPGGPPVLLGRSQRPPERPPRISVRLSSRQDAAG
jgi:hypothetical protein